MIGERSKDSSGVKPEATSELDCTTPLVKSLTHDPCGKLIDPMGRPITYLRVSLTENCNFRCSYCYGSRSRTNQTGRRLTDDEILRLLEAFARLGINKVRFTGGEPLLHRDIVGIVRGTSSLEGVSIVGLTTNGLLLDPLLANLIDAGLNRLNVSLDSLSKRTFRKITGVEGFERVFSAILNAEASGAFPRVKINTVVMRRINDSEIPAFARWALPRKLDLRFIEFMPTGRSGWGEELFLGEAEMRDRIGLDLEEEPDTGNNNGPARVFRCRDNPGRISFISAVSRSFCNGCNRLRLTSSGNLLGCLFQEEKVNLKEILDSGATTTEVADYILNVMAEPGFRRTPDEKSVSRYRPYMRAVGG